MPKARKPIRQKRKPNTAVKFDAQDRKNYLDSYIGAKKRRREHFQAKQIKQAKQMKHQQRMEDREVRAKEIQRLRELLEVQKQTTQLPTRKQQTQVFTDKKMKVEIKTTFM